MKKILLTILFCLLMATPFFAQDNGGKISGYMFGDYFYNISRDSLINDLSNKALEGEKI